MRKLLLQGSRVLHGILRIKLVLGDDALWRHVELGPQRSSLLASHAHSLSKANELSLRRGTVAIYRQQLLSYAASSINSRTASGAELLESRSHRLEPSLAPLRVENGLRHRRIKILLQCCRKLHRVSRQVSCRCLQVSQQIVQVSGRPGSPLLAHPLSQLLPGIDGRVSLFSNRDERVPHLLVSAAELATAGNQVLSGTNQISTALRAILQHGRVRTNSVLD